MSLFSKSLFDRLLALLLLVPALCICIPVLVAIRLESSGAPLFLQTRVGRNQRPFRLLKLRTMTKGTGDHASHEVSTSQITKVGHFLRKTKIDELPQIWNVLLGDMSFVGPRPCLPNQTELIAEREKRGVFSVRPGVTGPAQLAGIDMSSPQKLAEIDSIYVANRSFSGDLRMIVQTATGGGRGDAVKS